MDSGSVEATAREVEPAEAVVPVNGSDSEAPLRTSEEKFRTLFDAIEEGLVIGEVILNDAGDSVDYRILESNTKFDELTGLSRRELVGGRTARELIPSLEDSWLGSLGRVAVTGQSIRFESYAVSLDRWFEIHAFRIGDPSLRRVAALYNDITARRRAEFALRNSEKIQRYLLRLSDVLRPIAGPIEMMRAGPELLARELDVSAAGYVELSDEGQSALIGGQYADGRMPEFHGSCQLSDFGDGFAPSLALGEEIFASDIHEDPRGPAGGSEKTRDFRIRSVAGIPLIKNGQLVALFYAAHPETRPWPEWEREIVRQTAERTWAAVERARAETAQRKSEERYRALFNLVDQGFAVMEVLFDESGAADNLRFIEVNPAFEQRLGLTNPTGKTSRELMPHLEDSCLQAYGSVAKTGESIRFESYSEEYDRWLDIFASRVGGDGSALVSVLFDDITDRKRADAALRDSEERQAYLLRLSDALRPLSDPVEIQGTASRMLGEQLRADRTLYAEIDEALGDIFIARDHLREGVPSVAGRYPLGVMPWMSVGARSGKPAVVEDVQTTPVIPDGDRSAMQIAAFVAVPLVKNDRWVAALCSSSLTPRKWTEAEVGLVQETADRTWAAVERARAEAAKRVSEERYGTLFNSIDQGIAVVEVLYDETGAARDLRFMEANRVWEEQNRVTNPIGKTTSEVLPFLELSCVQRYGKVVETGESVRFECHLPDVSLWLDVHASRVGGAGSRVVSIVFDDVTERKRAEAAIRSSEERRAYLLKLSDALRPLFNPIEIQGTASRLLGEELRTDRTLYVEADRAKSQLLIARDYVRGSTPSVVGRYPIEAFSWVRPTTGKGPPAVVVHDVQTSDLIPEGDRGLLIEHHVGSFIGALLIKDGQPVAALCVSDAAPRTWTEAEVVLAQETAERTWAAVQRAQAEAALSASEEKYRTLFDSIDQGFTVIEVLYDASGTAHDVRIVEANRVFEKQTGLTNYLGKTRRELGRLEDFWIETYAHVAETGEPVRFEHYSAGLARWFSVFASRVGDAGSRLVNVVFDDITERQQNDAALRASEEKFRTLFDWIDQGYAVLEVVYEGKGAPSDLRFIDTNRVFEKQTGLRDHIGKTARELNPNLERHWIDTYARVVETGEHTRFDSYVKEIGRWFSIYASRLGGAGSRLVNVVFDDITVRRQNEAALRASEERQAYKLKLSDSLRPLLDPIEIQEAAVRKLAEQLQPDRIFYAEIDEERGEIVIDRDFAREGRPGIAGSYAMADYPWIGPAARMGRPLVVENVRDTALIADADRAVLSSTHVRAFIAVPLIKNGRLVAALCVTAASPRRWTDDEVDMVWHTGERTWAAVERERAVAALRASEERFRLFLENVHEYALVQCDADLRITSWNPGAERIFGYSSREILGRTFGVLLSPEDRATGVPCMTISDMEKIGRHEEARWLVHKDGQRIWARWVSEPIRSKDGHITGLTKVLRDETERLKTETSLRQSEKLAVVGRMASSIAHEINNPLEAVTNLIFLARRGVVSPEVGEFLEQAERELARVSHITSATLQFHRQTAEPHEVDIEEIVESVLVLHEGRLKSVQIAVERRYDWHPSIFCHGNEIRQVLANLVSNAVDAMVKNTDERRLIVRVGKAVDPETGEEGVRVMIADTGAGIRESARKHVFEPFFTTKSATGTGLGLWISAEAVQKQKGSLKFRSRTDGPYRGTVFSLFLKSL